jgi:hypothetical protein
MSAFPPPNVYFNGIIYDSDYFTSSSSGSGLTKAQANALYLRKTTTDTATALETFNSGIKTDSISSLSTTSSCTLFNDTGAGTLNTTLCSLNNIVRLGENAKFLNLGYNMPSSDGRYITIGAAAFQDTNIAIGGSFVNVISGFNNIYIGQSGKTVNISGSTNIISGTTTNIGGAANSAISIGTYSLQTSNILIGTKGAIVSGTDKIVIGGATNTLNLSSGTINLNNPLTPTYLPSSLSLFTQVGFVYKPTVTWTTFGDAIICTQTNIDAGVYMVSWNIQTTGAFINNFLYIFGLTTPTDSSRWAFAPTGISNINVCSGSTVISSSATFNFIMKNWATNTQSGGSGTTMQVWITRIA